MWPWLSTDCLARAGFSRSSIAAIPSAPPPPPPERACTGLARERESVGGARRFLPRGARAAAGGGGGRGDARGPREAGNDPRVPPRRPGIPPQALRKTRKAVLQPPSPPEPSFPADLSVLLNGSPLEHTSLVVTSPGSLLPCPWHPLVNGPFDSCYCLFSPAPGSYTPCPEVPGVEKRGCVG